MAVRFSALHAGHTLPPGFFIFTDSWYSFLLEAESTPGPVRPEGLGKVKGKVVPVLNLIKHYAMKAYGGVDV
jgi:hypothetical protein